MSEITLQLGSVKAKTSLGSRGPEFYCHWIDRAPRARTTSGREPERLRVIHSSPTGRDAARIFARGVRPNPFQSEVAPCRHRPRFWP